MTTAKELDQIVKACHEWAAQNNIQLSSNVTDPKQVTLKVTPVYPGDGIPNVWVALVIPELSGNTWTESGCQFNTELVGNGVNTVTSETAARCLTNKLGFARNRLMTTYPLVKGGYKDRNLHIVSRQDLRC